MIFRSLLSSRLTSTPHSPANTTDSALENLTLGNIAYIGLRYSSTTRAPPEYDDLTGKDLSKRPNYRFPCPSNAHIQLSQLYSAKQLPCARPIINVFEASPSSKKIEIVSVQKTVDIIYQINGSKEQTYSEPIFVGPGSYVVRAFSRKPGFRNSSLVEQSFNIEQCKPDELEASSGAAMSLIPEPDFSAHHESCQREGPVGRDKHNQKHASHSKYRGLHLFRNQVDSDLDDSDYSEPEK